MAANDSTHNPSPLKEIQNNIPIEIENKLEESLSVNESIPAANAIAPPPPAEPIPEDVITEHRRITQLKKNKIVELQRIHSISNVSEKSISISGNMNVPPPPVEPISDAIPLANKRNNDDPVLSLLSSNDVIAVVPKQDVIKEEKKNDIALEMIAIAPVKVENEKGKLK